jgi:hypothetical protein
VLRHFSCFCRDHGSRSAAQSTKEAAQKVESLVVKSAQKQRGRDGAGRTQPKHLSVPDLAQEEAEAPTPELSHTMGRKKVALAFYGLTRSLQYTIDSIRENVMDKLTAAGYDYDVYLHTYDLAGLQNARSGESDRLNTTEWQLLDPDYVEVTNQVRNAHPRLHQPQCPCTTSGRIVQQCSICMRVRLVAACTL